MSQAMTSREEESEVSPSSNAPSVSLSLEPGKIYIHGKDVKGLQSGAISGLLGA